MVWKTKVIKDCFGSCNLEGKSERPDVIHEWIGESCEPACRSAILRQRMLNSLAFGVAS